MLYICMYLLFIFVNVIRRSLLLLLGVTTESKILFVLVFQMNLVSVVNFMTITMVWTFGLSCNNENKLRVTFQFPLAKDTFN